MSPSGRPLCLLLILLIGACGRPVAERAVDERFAAQEFTAEDRAKLPPLCQSILTCCEAVSKADEVAAQKTSCARFGGALRQISGQMSDSKMVQICKSLVLTVGREIKHLPAVCKDIHGPGSGDSKTVSE